MANWILTNKHLISNELNPKFPSVVIVDTSISKWLLDVMNSASESDKKLSLAKEEIKELKLKILQLNQKIQRRDVCLKEAGIDSIKGRRKGDKKSSHGRKLKFSEKTCPGAGSRGPHPFTPTSGRQSMCPDCKRILKEIKNRIGTVDGITIRTSWRGGPNNHVNVSPEPKVNSNELLSGSKAVIQQNTALAKEDTQKKLIVEEVLRMDDGPEKRALEAKFTLAEKMEASKLRYKVEREKWREMRKRGYNLNDALDGVNHGQM